MAIRRYTVAVTTDGSGDATAYSPFLSGLLHQIQYVKTDYANGVDFTITTETTAQTLWAESNVDAAATRAPRQSTHSTAGVASLFAGGGTAVQDRVAIGRERVKIVVASGGATKAGTFHITVDDGK
jgi:hypothetical protein